VLLYNRRLLPSPPRTTDELLNIPRPEGADVILASNRADPLWTIPWIAGFGGRLLDDSGAPQLNSPEVVNALTFLKDLREKNVLITERTFGASVAHFKAGKVAMIVDGEWTIADYAEADAASDALELGVAAFPVVSPTNLPAAPFVSGSYLLLARALSGDKLAAATELVRLFTGRPVQARLAPELKRLPALVTALQAEAVQADPLLAASAQTMGAGRPLLAQKPVAAVLDAMQPHISAVLRGDEEPDAAAQAMQAAAEAEIATLRR
jgi:arabinogalactan oligomer/maltooligosaccharide transport system substrate-binding protein